MAAKLLTAQFNEIKKTFHCISYKNPNLENTCNKLSFGTIL